MNTELTDRSEIWPDELDAMTAAPEHHVVLLENEKVRVLDSVVRPGESTPVHTHRWPGVQYIIGISDFVRKGPEGEVLLDTRDGKNKPTPGTAVWSGPLAAHSVTNVGDSDIRVISVELKS